MKSEAWKLPSESYHEGRRMEHSPLKFRATRLRSFLESAIYGCKDRPDDFPTRDLLWKLNFMGDGQEDMLRLEGKIERFMDEHFPSFDLLKPPPLFYSIAEELFEDFKESKRKALALPSWSLVDRHWEMVGGFITSRATATPVFESLRLNLIACAEARDAAFEKFNGETVKNYLNSVATLSLYPNYFLLRNHMSRLSLEGQKKLGSLDEIQTLRDELEVEALWSLHTTQTPKEMTE